MLLSHENMRIYCLSVKTKQDLGLKPTHCPLKIQLKNFCHHLTKRGTHCTVHSNKHINAKKCENGSITTIIHKMRTP